ncbi:MAG: hypothetical protein R3E98_07860 [Gemmatimonadota bacterium]
MRVPLHLADGHGRPGWLALAGALAAGLLSLGVLAWLTGTGPAGSALSLAPLPVETLGLQWSPRTELPDVARARALARWVGLLRLACALVILAAVVPVLLGALLAGRAARPELHVHRDVGASARLLRRAFLQRTVAFVGAAGTVAGVGAAVLLPWLARAWPGVWSGTLGPWAASGLLGSGAVVATAVGAMLLWWGGGLLAPASERGRIPGAQDGFVVAGGAASTLVCILAFVLLGAERPDASTAGPPDLTWASVTAPSALDTASLLHGLAALPGVTRVGATTPGGWSRLGIDSHVATECGDCWIGGLPTPMLGGWARVVGVAGAALDLMGVPLVAGRGPSAITAADPPAVWVSEGFAARQFERGRWAGRSALVGRDLDRWYAVEGVTGAGLPVLAAGAAPPAADQVFVSLLQHPVRALELGVEGAADPGAVRSALESLLPAGATVEVAPLAGRRALDRAPIAWISRLLLLALVAAVALSTLTAALGARLLARARTYELGVRRAVGATRGWSVRWLLLGSLGRTLTGALVGAWAVLFFRDGLATLLGGTAPLGAASVLALALQGLAGLAGAWPVARRAPAAAPAALAGADPLP